MQLKKDANIQCNMEQWITDTTEYLNWKKWCFKCGFNHRCCTIMIKQLFTPIRNTKIFRREKASRFMTILWPHKDSVFWNLLLKLLPYGILHLIVSRLTECTPPGTLPHQEKQKALHSFQPISSSVCQFQRFAKDKIWYNTAINCRKIQPNSELFWRDLPASE